MEPAHPPGHYVRWQAAFQGTLTIRRGNSFQYTDRPPGHAGKGRRPYQTPDPAHKQKFIYNLTLKGIDLLPIIKEIGTWSLKHAPVDKKKYPHASRRSQLR